MSARKFALSLSALLTFLAFNAFAQQPSCNVSSTPFVAATEGLSELMAPITFSCSGGTAGSTVSTDIYLTLNTNITNRVGSTGQPTNILVTVDTGSGSGPLPVASTNQYSGNSTVILNQVSYVVPSPNTTMVTVQVSGIRAAVANITGGTASGTVTVQILNTGLFITNSNIPIIVAATLGPSMLATIQNTGLPCSGSILPSGTFGFPDLISAATAFSTVRVTEGDNVAFSPRGTGADYGNRIVVSLSGYPSTASVYVPTAVVGNYGTTPTSGGTLEESASGGIYTSGQGQLLLLLVAGADATGNGGTVSGAPGGVQSLAGVAQVTLSGGVGYAVYEVVDGNPNGIDSAQIPIFVGSPAAACSSPISQSVAYGPVSTVTIATPTDPIPRFVAETPGPDCQIFNDCGNLNPPSLVVNQTSLALTGNSQGNPQSATVNVTNGGQGTLSFTTAVSYQTSSGWLTVSPAAGSAPATVTVTADPTNLVQGVYMATVSISAGAAGVVNIPLTFNVGPIGVTIKGIVSAASFQVGGPVTPNSYVAIFGVNLGGTNVSVVAGGNTCITCITYAGSTQVNFLLPQTAAANLIAGYIPISLVVDGKVSNNYSVTLATNAPGVFNPGIINENGTVNTSTQPTSASQYISVYMTGLALPVTGTVTVTMGTLPPIVPLYSGASSSPGEEQINVTVPAGLTLVGGSVPLSVCVSQAGSQPPLCSPSVNLYVH
jgi:uncharacterized protein (TIGR03437 family)